MSYNRRILEYRSCNERPAVPVNIFLSYGHDRNAELVQRIKADLKAAVHTV
jgi:hypothetical protein